jgi:uncharacterized membrane protein (UPF0182 family)
MRDWKFFPKLIAAALLLGLGLYVAFYFVFLDFFVDLWWFRSLEFEAYFWLRFLYRFIFSAAVTLFFFSIFMFHFYIASRYLGLNPPDEILMDDKKRRRFQRVADLFLYGSLKVYTPIALLLAVGIALPFYWQWEQALLFFFGEASGVLDPIYGNDVSFYLFSYPVFELIQQELLITAAAVFLVTAILYWAEHVFIPNQSKQFPIGAKIHLAILFLFVVAFVVWGFALERFALLYSSENEPIFFGPGLVQIRYYLPLIWLSMAAVLAVAGLILFYVFSGRSIKALPILTVVLLIAGIQGLRTTHVLPNLIEKFIVKPNFSRAEADNMHDNIVATLSAYDLNDIKTIDFKVVLDARKDIEAWSTTKHFENIPVWDRELLIDSYKQLQGIRPYYDFPTVDEDRYFINGHHQQVNLAAREINLKKLPNEAQNWENTHLRYTHGYGAVVSPAAQDAGIPIVWYLRDLDMSSNVGFAVEHPDIYYGKGQYEYAIVPNGLASADISSSKRDVGFNGAGIPISSWFRKVLLAFHLKDEKIFFSPNINHDSHLLNRRNIEERIHALTPFLHLDKDPYLVINNDRFYWIQDAYTTSNYYPVSKPVAESFQAGPVRFNYIRNAVKIVVDAYDGSVDYYIADNKDPVINAYRRAYPGLFKKIEQMPETLLEHLRYPRDLYNLQMKIYAKYHQTSPELFYEQAETWENAKVGGQPLLPYFITMDMDRCNDQEEFVMIDPMTPIHRDNLSMVGVASTLDEVACDHRYKPSISVFKFPKEVQVNGPSQVNALIDQNPEISAQFTLWNQQGSEIRKGRMVVLPMGNSILYVQPIYTLATKTKMPELARVIVSIGNQVVMDKTLLAAFERLKALFVKGSISPRSGTSSVH